MSQTIDTRLPLMIIHFDQQDAAASENRTPGSGHGDLHAVVTFIILHIALGVRVSERVYHKSEPVTRS